MTTLPPTVGAGLPTSAAAQQGVRFGALSPETEGKIKRISGNEDVEALVDIYQSLKAEDKQTTDADDQSTLKQACTTILNRVKNLLHSTVNRPRVETEEVESKHPFSGQTQTKLERIEVANYVPRMQAEGALALLQKLETSSDVDAPLGNLLRDWGMGGNPISVRKAIQKPYREQLERFQAEDVSPVNQTALLLELNQKVDQDLQRAKSYPTAKKDQQSVWTNALKEVQEEVKQALSGAIGSLSPEQAEEILNEAQHGDLKLDKRSRFDLVMQTGVEGEALQERLAAEGLLKANKANA